MKRAIATVAACAVGLMVFAGGAAAGDKPKPNNEAAKICAAEKHADRAAFEATYGPKHAMRNCKRAHRGDGGTTPADAGDEFANAAQECRAEREADPAAFQATYGTNGNGRNAFGKCVSQRVHEEETEPPTA